MLLFELCIIKYLFEMKIYHCSIEGNKMSLSRLRQMLAEVFQIVLIENKERSCECRRYRTLLRAVGPPTRGCDAWLDMKAVLMEEVCIILTLFH